MPVARSQAEQEHRKSFRTKTLRLHPLENLIFEQACEALNGMERTQLMQEAVIHEAARLGIRWTVEPAPPLTSSWPYMPQRGRRADRGARLDHGEPAGRRDHHARGRARSRERADVHHRRDARAHRAPQGSASRAIHAETPEEARDIRAGLDKIKLPPQYQYPPRSKRALIVFPTFRAHARMIPRRLGRSPPRLGAEEWRGFAAAPLLA